MPKNSDKPEKSDILFGQTRILVKDLPLFYYARRKFEYDGRPLTREECNDLISYKMNQKKAVNEIQHDVYDIFDDDTQSITKSLEKSAQEHEASFHLQVKDLLQLLLSSNEDFRNRRAKLHRFPGKMSDRLVLKVAEIPAIDAKNLRVDELYLFYHLFRYVEVGAGQPLEEGRVRLVWQDKRKKEATGKIKEIRGSLQAFKILEPPNNDLTRAIASVITLKEHIFFSNRAVEWYSPYDDTAHLNQSFADTRYSYPQNLLPEEVAALTMTAGPSDEPAPDWSNLDDFDTPPPSDKRPRESDSSSPGNGEGPSKGKGKEKEQAPQSKRPRDSRQGQKK